MLTELEQVPSALQGLNGWRCATVAVLIVGLSAEMGGAYFALRRRIGASLEPNDLTQLFKIWRNWWWLRFWIVKLYRPDDEGRWYEWRSTTPGPLVALAHNVIRVAIGAFFIVKIAITGAPY